MISHAIVETDRPERYAKQLVSHLSRKCQTEFIENGSRIIFALPDRPYAVGHVLVAKSSDAVGKLVIVAESDSHDGHDLAVHVLGDHLIRFGVKDGLRVTWVEGPFAA